MFSLMDLNCSESDSSPPPYRRTQVVQLMEMSSSSSNPTKSADFEADGLFSVWDFPIKPARLPKSESIRLVDCEPFSSIVSRFVGHMQSPTCCITAELA